MVVEDFASFFVGRRWQMQGIEERTNVNIIQDSGLSPMFVAFSFFLFPLFHNDQATPVNKPFAAKLISHHNRYTSGYIC